MVAPAGEAPSEDTLNGRMSRWLLEFGPVALLAALTLALEESERPGAEVPTLILVVLPLIFRAMLPLPVLLVVVIGATLTGSSVPAPYVQILAIILASIEVGRLSTDRTRSLLAVIGIAALMTIGISLEGADIVEATVLPFVFLVPSWLFGDLLRQRRIDALQRAEEDERSARDREQRLQEAAAEERRHVARELHDVIAHGVSVMVVQAGAARQVVRASPEAAEESLLAVETTGREAMAELRRFLGALGDDAAEGGLTPQPGIADVPALVARIHEAGLPATLEVEGEPTGVSASLDVTVYRVVQEALTNALRYAAQAATVVRLAWEPDRLRIEVLDDGPGTAEAATEGAGRGLAGMRDRVELAGGHVEAGPRLGGGYAVRAWLPLEPTVA